MSSTAKASEGVSRPLTSLNDEENLFRQSVREFAEQQVRPLAAEMRRVYGENAAVGIDEIRSDLLPEGKVEAIGELVALHGRVAMVGDGVNDAAVLAGAPLVSVMSLINRPYYRCWVQPEITRMEELRGKTLGVSRFGSVTDNLTRILLRRYHLEGAVQIRQMGGTTEMAAAFQRRQIDGAVMATVRINAPTRMLVDLEELGIRYSNVVIAASRDYHRRNPEIIEAMVRAYLEGVAAVGQQKEKALQVIQKYTRLQDPKLIQDLYADGVKFLERVPRLDAEALAPIVEFMGKKPIPVETVADNSIVNRLEREGFIDKLYGKR